MGGPATFMRNLKSYLDKNGLSYASEVHGSTGIFFPIQHPSLVLDMYKKNGGAIIQRLDGVYYPSKHGQHYDKINAPIKEIYQRYATHIIFQSEYSKKQCFAMLGEKNEDAYSLIYNGVDTSVFRPTQKVFEKSSIVFVTTGNFRNLDMLEPVVIALDTIAKHYRFKLIVIGPVSCGSIQPLLDRPYIDYKGSLMSYDIAEVLKVCDIFIYSHLNPPCPNSVLEAIATGLPVVGFDSGAMKELCFFSRHLLAPVSDNIFQEYGDFQPEVLAEKITFSIENFSAIKEVALMHTDSFNLEKCGAQYSQIFIQQEVQYQQKVFYPNWKRYVQRIRKKLF